MLEGGLAARRKAFQASGPLQTVAARVVLADGNSDELSSLSSATVGRYVKAPIYAVPLKDHRDHPSDLRLLETVVTASTVCNHALTFSELFLSCPLLTLVYKARVGTLEFSSPSGSVTGQYCHRSEGLD